MSIKLSKDNADLFLKEFAKELRKVNKNVHMDIIIVGGGSVLLNYNFRTMTEDFDIIKPHKLLDIKEPARKIQEKYSLSSDWINDNFLKTESYTPKLRYYCKFYKTYSNYIHYYTISDEYLIAMKLKSFRDYKNDISDILGILYENKDINYDKVKTAYINLYDDLEIEKKEILSDIMNIPRNQLLQSYNKMKKFKAYNRTKFIHDNLNELDEKNDFSNESEDEAENDFWYASNSDVVLIP
ncbi:MAG: DUF6036 family nucleotidyltransferase [Erysipelotrichaceae bacterium]|nr:DUF6036 family nucleotidyltransferase [Erysipelotrichaceae bacterium]